VHTYDSHLEAAFHSLQEWLALDFELFIDVDRSLWYDFIELLFERHEAASLRRIAAKKGKRSTSEGERSNTEDERSNIEDERSNSRDERGKNSQAGAA